MQRKIGNKRELIIWMICILIAYCAYSWSAKHFNSYQRYKSAGLWVCPIMPEEPRDFKGVSKHFGILGGIDIYSFSVSQEEYDELSTRLIETYYPDSVQQFDQKYGLVKYYGMKVGDINSLTPDYEGDDFCNSDLFKYVSEIPVEEYTVLHFHPTGTGSVEEGVFYDPVLMRMIYYRGGTIK